MQTYEVKKMDDDFTLIDKEVMKQPVTNMSDDDIEFEEITSIENRTLNNDRNRSKNHNSNINISVHDPMESLNEKDNINHEYNETGSSDINDDDNDNYNYNDDETTTTNQEERRNKSAIVVASIAGCAVGGIIGGILLGVSAGVAINVNRYKHGIAGDIARAFGDVGLSAEDRAKEVEEKHRIFAKTKESFRRGWRKVQEKDKRQYLKRSGETIASAFRKVARYEKEHKVVGTVTKSFQDGIAFMSNPYDLKK